ncbi:hypothetical protein C8Q80DRAFT_125920 [Daedaleopsis nitida]|nr:hypothetical protein C8Q80DRAFT_125920 [Daedaleopsis nitida]
MSAQYDFARPAKQVYPMDNTRLHMASKNASYLPPHSHHSPTSRRPPVDSTSLPSSSWLSEATDFVPLPPSRLYLGVGSSTHGTESFSSSGSVSESSQHHRAQSRDYLLSTSPTPSPHPGSRTQSRHTPSPSPIPSPSQTLHQSRSFTVSSPHKTSGMSSDRDASGHLDIKRLMSKPARQVPSGSVSLPSDSERSGDASSSRVGSSRRPTGGTIPHPPMTRSASVSREKLSLHVHTTGLRSSSAPRQGHTSSPERKSDGKPPRNVLRRRPSSRSNPSVSSAAVHHTRAATDDVILPSRSASTKAHHTNLRDDTPARAYVPRSMTSPSTSASRPSQSSRMKPSIISPRSPHVTTGLTPAGAVALAYKQQERRREELAETASFNDAYQTPQPLPKPAAPSAHRQDTSASEDPRDDEEEEGGEPYYTVFGSSSGRVVAVGSPQDDDWLFNGYGHRATVPVSGKPTGSTQSLSRKVSGSLKRVTGSIKRSERDHRDLPTIPRDEWKPYDGTRGVPGRSSPLQPLQKLPRKPVALDMSLDMRVNPKSSPTRKASPVTKGSPSPQEDGRASRSSKTKGIDREDDNSATSSGKWWKLMKRISTGGLREKYQQDPPPPPVPALPRNLQATAPSRTTMDLSSRNGHVQEVGENGVLLRRFMQSRASMSGVRPMLSPPKSSSSRPSTSSGTIDQPSTAKSRASISVHRPSTRSSSLGSSEKASSAFLNNHNPVPSTRSSFSSFGEEIPPVPKNIGQYIVPPSELSRMTKSTQEHVSSSPSQSQSRRPRTSIRVQTAPLEDSKPELLSSPEGQLVASLPLPPRRSATTGGIVHSPIAPSFNVEDTINNLMPPMHSGPLPLTEFGMKEPPPRPKRSSRRAPPPSVDIPTRSQSMSATMPHSPATPRAPPQVRVDVNMLRQPSASASSHGSTPKQISGSSSSNSPASALSTATSPMSAVSQKRSPLTFREIESPRHKLTEKEKADKWEDLLERSARAGGTLHLGDSHLLSDQPDINAADESFFHGSDA